MKHKEKLIQEFRFCHKIKKLFEKIDKKKVILLKCFSITRLYKGTNKEINNNLSYQVWVSYQARVSYQVKWVSYQAWVSYQVKWVSYQVCVGY